MTFFGLKWLLTVCIMKQGRLVAVREKEDFKHEDLEQIYMHEMQATEST